MGRGSCTYSLSQMVTLLLGAFAMLSHFKCGLIPTWLEIAFGAPLLALRDHVLGACGQECSWETTLFSCTLSLKQKGKSGLTPAERVVKGKPVLERSGGGSAALEPPSKRGYVVYWPWLMLHRSHAKPSSEGRNADGVT